MKVLFKNISHNHLKALQDYLSDNQKLRKVTTAEGDLAADSLALEVSIYNKYTALIVSGNYAPWCENAIVVDNWDKACNFVTKLKRV